MDREGIRAKLAMPGACIVLGMRDSLPITFHLPQTGLQEMDVVTELLSHTVGCSQGEKHLPVVGLVCGHLSQVS